MLSSSRLLLISSCILILSSFISAHTVITYPGWRGDNLHENGTIEQFVESGGLGVGPNNTYPYGMQWMYPCGGMPLTTNRTKWPIGGGALSVQPGWFTGHATAFFYVNLGFGTLPPNMSNSMIPVFQIVGPSKDPYGGQFCLPQVPLPAGYTPNVGDNATIQVVETAIHGAALYSCVDITFDEPEEVVEVTRDNCYNSSDISMQLVFSTTSLSGASSLLPRYTSYFASIPLITALLWGLL